MTESELIRLINVSNDKNPLKIKEGDSYDTEFIKLTGQISRHKDVLERKIKNDLLDGEYSEFKYNQSIAEMIIWFFCEQTGLEYSVERKLNPPKDVDFQVIQNGVNYNIEVKSPEYEISDKSVLTGRIASRTEKVDLKETLLELDNLFKNNLENTEFDDVKMVLPKDNKIKDCLLSCQEKFIESDEKNFNVLLLCTTSDEMSHYLEYFMNTESGFFTKNSYVPHKDFNKIGAVAITNAISVNREYAAYSWNVFEAKTIVLDNPFCKYINHEHIGKFRAILPNCTGDFWSGLEKFRIEKPDFPEIIYYIDYIKKSTVECSSVF